MSTKTPEERELIQKISKDIVTQVAPEEVDLFDELMQEYFDNPQVPARSSSVKDEALGSGLGESLIAITTIAASIASTVIDYLAYVNSHKKPDGADALTKEQLQSVKRLAFDQAILFGIEAVEAEKMTNALIGTLTLQS